MVHSSRLKKPEGGFINDNKKNKTIFTIIFNAGQETGAVRQRKAGSSFKLLSGETVPPAGGLGQSSHDERK